MEDEIKKFVEILREMPDFNNVEFVILFGSQAEGRANKLSDYDFAVYYKGDKRERFKFLLRFGGKLPDNFDIKIIQDLPLPIQKEVLKGKVIYAREISFVYDYAYEIIKRFEDFRRYYYDYLGMVKIT
ncbi:nucleotidyltransferase domain-containing protein [Candidatus Pacearchaeota archaeon]|nr:nucleotidyltransferase domain-containing protein [Candidatus Pacearchaeota archaeon]